MGRDLIKAFCPSAAALFNGIAWIQYGNTNATMRMRLGFFSFVLHLLFSLRLSVLSLFLRCQSTACASFARISDNSKGNERRRRRRHLSTLWERVKKKHDNEYYVLDENILNEKSFSVFMRRDVLNVVARCLVAAKSAMV